MLKPTPKNSGWTKDRCYLSCLDLNIKIIDYLTLQGEKSTKKFSSFHEKKGITNYINNLNIHPGELKLLKYHIETGDGLRWVKTTKQVSSSTQHTDSVIQNS
jgi:hypothetical protein